ncbi:MAG: secondary thiamine-phosphate synthase enzyme YjbQ [Armatimonadota bacterium]
MTKTFALPTSSRRQVLDITGEVSEIISNSDISSGLCTVSVPHCTCAVYINEHEDGLVRDVLTLLDGLVSGEQWHHDRIDHNAGAHLSATVLGNSVLLPVEGGNLVLGTWQRLLLVELDGPRHRRVNVTLIGG